MTWELGEDFRSESRLRQDQTWKEAVSDGRAHISHREANHVHYHLLIVFTFRLRLISIFSLNRSTV